MISLARVVVGQPAEGAAKEKDERKTSGKVSLHRSREEGGERREDEKKGETGIRTVRELGLDENLLDASDSVVELK